MSSKSTMSYFRSSIIFALFALPIGYWIGGLIGMYSMSILAILEVSLSVDNAVVNAKILSSWDQKWRARFILWGMLIAVFGMRLIFPIMIVSVTTDLSPLAVLSMAANEPDKYAASLEAVHHEVLAFGGAFLMMVALSFFLNQHKDEHWLSWFEKPMTRLGQIEAIEMALVLITLYFISNQLDMEKQIKVIISGIFGLITYIAVKGFASLMSSGEESADVGEHLIKQGIGGFIYLEVLDASFSFDGVIGAFALSNNIFIIMLGLGIGAFAVRSITIMLVDKGTMSTYRYLEHGAFWAIFALALIMLIGLIYEIPEWFTGLLGAFMIVLALISSIQANKKDVDGKSYAY
ncbi:MAG: DUF475 domain-containing protein [Sulfuricurvum sp.]|uniref:DUF475 domain-containing protein n=1 Tax=Sulfuricurvum sp. TaxID=2025608 RepID=UPI002603FF7B|nr:DUF475 domain-containing protein [Sulfuricurvum sp.]MDD2368449.1 DUF475 domain-containing protein [Sulfuricurvum sp.]MDD5119025.1 DUF475 domain-containing protein [Sulfuricurvum sp.]